MIENKESELNFFTDALKKSKLNFLCSIAKSEEQAVRILKNIVPDLIFIDLNTAGGNPGRFLRNIINVHADYVVLYSNMSGNNIIKATHHKAPGCIRLPANIQSVAFMLQHLLNS